MVNGDDPDKWALIEKLGVDAIPHLALLNDRYRLEWDSSQIVVVARFRYLVGECQYY